MGCATTCVAICYCLGSMLLLAAEGVRVSDPDAGATHGLAIAGLVLFVLGSVEWVCESVE
jgi:hypothetical protein